MSAGSRTRRPSGRTRRAAVAATATALVGALGTAPAAARPATPTLHYTCVFPTIGGQAITAGISADVPDTLPVGESSPAFAVRATATVEASFTIGLRYVLGVRTIEGSVDAETRVLAPQGETVVPVHLAITRTSVPAYGAFEIPATGNAPRLSFGRPGSGRVSAGNFTLHLVPRDADGNLAGPGRVDVPCTLNAGQDGTVAPFEVTPAKASPTPSSTTLPSAPAPSSASPATASPGTDASAAASSAPVGTAPPAPPPAASAPATAGAPRASASRPWAVALGAAAVVAALAAAAVVLRRRTERRGPSGPAA
ncbi:hypothetical protein Kpho02_50070 [Kitasatospora phosalacinea]|uniref:DUF6801 domain-containing protein n=1 Tax=Kitasatospora phosalacinea TaxID=2065 RepID=A0A9W6V3Y9_9ACTN|nr:DUF6801 domain-containing protein [Kitasatospora phosalacinea]GLW72708.1 hypothetical protein Kpho02_50070 [Kitasatospora phosalacinea]